MARTIIGPGAHGEIARTVQNVLLGRSFLQPQQVDGWYWNGTQAAVSRFQTSVGVNANGIVDDVTWAALLPGIPIPSLLERCLALTAAFEGHGYGLPVGDFDGAGLTWGIIGFTLKHGEVGEILREIQTDNPTLIQEMFGPHAAELLRILKRPIDDQLRWAQTITVSGGRLAEPWRTSFQTLGASADVQRIQRAHAERDYFVPACETAAGFGLKTELGAALCFDIHVQNGGVSKRARAAIKPATGGPESTLRESIARAVGNAARAAYRDDVLARKLTIARGRGKVHGADYELENWGLADIECEQPIRKAVAANA